MKRIAVWIPSLSMASVLCLLPAFARHGRLDVYYLEAAGIGLLIARLLRFLGMLRTAPHRVDPGSEAIRVDSSDSPRLRIQGYLPSVFTSELFKQNSYLQSDDIYPNKKVRANRVLTNLRKSAGWRFFGLLQLLENARAYHSQEGESPKKIVIIDRNAALANSVSASTLANDLAGPDVSFIGPWSASNSLPLQLASTLAQCLPTFKQHLPHGYTQNSAYPAKAMISVGSAWGLDRSAALNDLHWWWDSEIPADRVLITHDGGFSADEQTVSAARQAGIQCVGLTRRDSGPFPEMLFKPKISVETWTTRSWQTVKVFVWGLRKRRIGGWMACRSMSLLRFSWRYEDYIRAFNIRAVLHPQDAGLDYVSLACDATGAARIGQHWSHFVWPEDSVARVDQVFFAWGQHYVGVMEAKGSCVDHVLLSGPIVNSAPQTNEVASLSEVQIAAENVRSAGATRLLAIFDTSFPCDRFYRFFLNRVIEDSRWGLLIKTKGLDSLPWTNGRMPELRSLYGEANQTGRVALIDHMVSPVEAAAVVDFSVGVDINTATVLVMLAGLRAAHLDYVRLHESPLSKWAKFHIYGNGQVLFDDPTKLWTRLNDFIDNPASDPRFGLADDALLKDVDTFQDNRTGPRMGGYLHDYLEASDKGMERDEALTAADRLYAERWGADAVVKNSHGTKDIGSRYQLTPEVTPNSK